MGPQTVLSAEEEKNITEWILDKAKLGFPMHPDIVNDAVQEVLQKTSKKWLKLFLKRHPDIKKRNTEIISKSCASVTEEGLHEWYSEVRAYLMEENCIDIVEDAIRIACNFVLKSGKVLGPRDLKNLYEVTDGQQKESITVLCTFTVNGDSVPPMIIYPYKELPLPVILFLDGHKSHISLEVSEFCAQKEILLYCLPPTATHIMQPCDVCFFHPLKVNWRKFVQHENQICKTISKSNFAPIFQKAFDATVHPQLVQNAFVQSLWHG
ncbi:hypothetical protein PR048_000382 [Dryococelus australis]|uniref:HTH CENPB-type domain-containing protein n=1 Tax=Dryococelus australis TaxID=614101 RepID=A0ABQ9IF01_9NEOP|nr:hypothetical protein PR048_000382 [Dryococelus australis]